MSELKVQGLTKIFGDHPQRAIEALEQGLPKSEVHEKTGQVVGAHNVSFEVGHGELFVVMGLSGSGKSTVVRMINRLFEPTAGSIEIDGEDVLAMNREELRRLRMSKVSMVFQHFALFPHRTVGENAAYGLKIQGVGEEERRRRANEALERVGLGGWFDSMPHELSGGMQQRVGLARGLATEADLLLMDEPFSALDPLIRRDMQDLLAGLQEELDRTIIFITHDLNEAMRLGDRIVVMRGGEVVQIGTGEEIIHNPANTYVEEFVADVDRSRVLTAQLAMREPRKLFTLDASPRDVLSWLDDADVNGVYVVDGERRVLGVARDDKVAEGIRKGATDVRDLLLDDYARVAIDTPLNEISPLAAQHTVAVAVTDDDGRLLGVVRRAALLAALSGEEAPNA